MMGVFDSEARKVAGAKVYSSTTIANSNPFTFPNGVPLRATEQKVVVVCAFAGVNTRSITSATIAGVAAAVRLQPVDSDSRACVLDALVPAGAAGDVVITLNGALGAGSVFMVATYFLGAAVFRTSANDVVGTPPDVRTVSIAVLKGEFAIGVVNGYASGVGAGAYSWIGLSEDVDVHLRDSQLSAASFAITADGTLAVSATSHASIADLDDAALAVAIYEPA